MKFTNKYGTTLEVISLDEKYVTYRIYVAFNDQFKVDTNCVEKESFQRMLKKNNYELV